MQIDTVDDVIRRLPKVQMPRLPAPKYTGTSGERRTFMAVKSMSTHMTDEGWQIALALASGGYGITGHGIGECQFTDCKDVLDHLTPDVLGIQDKREYEGKTAGPGFDASERFQNVHILSSRESVFKFTILKDAQHNPAYHCDSASEIGCHAWVAYYNPRIVCHLAPYVRQEHIVRTYHTVNRELVPVYKATRFNKALLSGAVSKAYPLRMRLLASHYEPTRDLKGIVDVLPHPGYGRNHCYTPEYLTTLSHYKVAICTCSVYGYALRKIVEGTACGCIVVTNLPSDETLPGIDENLVRVSSDISTGEMGSLIKNLITSYNPERQAALAEVAKARYDYRTEGIRLAGAIETLRQSYNGGQS